MTLHIYRDTKKEWRWRLKARNGRIVADSAESYQRFTRCAAMAIKIFPNTLLVWDEREK